jgi:ribonucleotide monophosphatase NagD (HAD superfamily)
MDTVPACTAILGDRLETDILAGQRLGLTTILVTTGIDRAEAVAQKGITPDLIVSGLDELARLWELALQE